MGSGTPPLSRWLRGQSTLVLSIYCTYTYDSRAGSRRAVPARSEPAMAPELAHRLLYVDQCFDKTA